MGAPDNRNSATEPPATDALIWPPPAGDLDVLWLDGASHAAPAVSAPSSTASVPLSRLRSGVTVEWHDAVALLQQFLDQAAPDRARPPAGSVPALGAIEIDPSGRLVFTLNPPGEPLVKGLGRLLNELLQSNPAPANLRLLGWQAASDSAAPLSLAEFGQQLAGWERPNRAAAMAALYDRAANAKHETAASLLSVVDEPFAPPAAASIAPLDRPHPAVVRTAAVLDKRPVAYAAAAAVFVGGAALALYTVRQNTLESVSTPIVGLASSSTGSDVMLPTVAGRRAHEVQPASREPAPPLLRSSAPPVAPSAPVAASVSANDQESLEQPPLELFGEAAPAVSREPPLYTSDDASIAEPQLIRPYLPFRAHAGTPPDALGVLELVVDTHGAVESVHLNSPDNRYRERWWVFAAKNWQFRPAMKNGVPVRFLKRIPLTDLNMLEPQ